MTREVLVYPSSDGFAFGTRIVWLVKGPDLVVQFMCRLDRNQQLEPWYLGFHCSFDPGWASRMDDCKFFPNGCWYDGSSLNAEPVFARMCREGTDGLWSELEDYARTLWTDFAETKALA